jgi:hypothetical protein
MLKEDPRYDYIESRDTSPASAARTSLRRRDRPKGLTLPVGFSAGPAIQALPLQAYLQQRFSQIGGKSRAARALRDENQRRHDRAASLGHWQMSRTS